ncbi:MAG: prepilin-type N-terminal cleavage/methylation domain-containing protein [Gammaproteobacteria bacterium]|nr:prepilin-type N-terminal cleavage/methylation domain-containing protein [Gammaproteobacteria bacterium]
MNYRNQKPSFNRARNLGFTLMELMIVVAIIGLLAGIAYPQYGQYVIRGKRTEGRGALMDGAARLERFYSDNNAYADTANVIHSDTGISANSESGYYALTIVTATPFQSFTLTATPANGFVDTECGALTLTNAGTKGEGGTATDISSCWGK